MPILRVDLYWTRSGNSTSQATWETPRICTRRLLKFECISSSNSPHIITVNWITRLQLAASRKYGPLLLSFHQVKRVESRSIYISNIISTATFNHNSFTIITILTISNSFQFWSFPIPVCDIIILSLFFYFLLNFTK